MVVRLNVPAPPVTPRPYGLSSVAVVIDGADPHEALSGISYEPESCGAEVYETPAACINDVRPLGDVSISVSDTGLATITATDTPGGSFAVTWGDGATTAASPLNGATHQYAGPGDYVVTIDGPDGWGASGTVTVVDATGSGPFVLEVGYTKIATDGIDLVEGEPVALYHLHRCRAVGDVDVRERAADALRLGEWAAIEAFYERTVLAPNAVNLTPAGGAVSPAEAVAILERYSAANYKGVPVIHGRADFVTLAHDVVGRQGIRLETELGTLVAVGGGYAGTIGPGEVAAGAGEVWAYVTGTVLVRRSDVVAVDTFDLSPATNEVGALVERTATIASECIVGAVLVNVPEDPA